MPLQAHLDSETPKTKQPKSEPANRYTLSDLASDAINDSSDIPDIEPVILIGGANFAVKGDISIVGGQPKTGKTTISSFMMATAFMKEIDEENDFLQIRTTYCEDKPIIYIDTEQPKAYTNKLRQQVLKLLGVDNQPENLHIYNFRKYDAAGKKDRVEALMKELPEAHLWIVDGVADLITDPNDTKQSFGIIETFLIASDKYNTTVVLYIHKNPGVGSKLRGNLGSEAERKCGGAISLTKDRDKGIHAIKPMVIRGSSDFDPIYFQWSNIEKRMVSLDESQTTLYEKMTDPSERKLELRTRLADKVTLKGMENHKYGDLVKRILDMSKEVEGKTISERTAKTRVTEMIDMELLEKDETTELYSLAT